MRASLIVAAGGSGSRFLKSLESLGKKTGAFESEFATRVANVSPSKLFYPLGGKPLIERTLGAFQNIPNITETVIAVPPQAEKILKGIILKNKWRKVRVVRGGQTRAESVYKALVKTSEKNPLIFVHDGARPFISKESVEKLLKISRNADAVILGRKVVPTIKETAMDGSVKRTVDRRVLCEAETPQVAKRKLLLKAYREVPQALQATDESSLMEAIGVSVQMVTHEDWNPKITTYKDFELAEAYLNRQAVVRTGFGRDTHRLVEKRKMILGGIPIPSEKGPLGHSDGDALLHAITDAILGATGAGDIGDWFSDKNPKFKNIASAKMLRAVVEDASAKGFFVTHVDTVTILERPKLAAYKTQIKKNIAKILNLPPDCVSVKAKTAEGLGPEGEGLAVTCEALVTLRKQP